MVYKERPDIIEKHPEFEAEYARLIEPVLRAQQDETFLAWYKRKNPNIAVRMGE